MEAVGADVFDPNNFYLLMQTMMMIEKMLMTIFLTIVTRPSNVTKTTREVACSNR